MMYRINASIVTYKNEIRLLRRAINSFLNTTMNVKLYIIDNSPTNEIKQLCNDEKIEYFFNNANIGYGAAHNISIRKSLNSSKYHLVFNPDVYYESGTIEKLYEFMEKNKDVGLVMPKILYPDGSIQFLCKLLPTPFDLIFRRFLPLKKVIEKRNQIYELRFSGYNQIMDVPYLSGCFMFLRNEALKKVGLFDERFFMYPEDIDLTRRIHKYHRTVYYPEVSVYHMHAKGSYKDKRLLLVHIKSMIKYFNKWGWFFDKERKLVNKNCIEKLRNCKHKDGCRPIPPSL